jgi:hypothetical protein
MDVLRGLAQEGRTLIVTIHQPRSDLFAHFGNILLLARGGHPIYAGPADSMLAHFAGLGHECPRHVNPADFALDLITVDLQHERREAASRKKVRKLVESWNASVYPVARVESITTPAELGSMAREPSSFASAYSDSHSACDEEHVSTAGHSNCAHYASSGIGYRACALLCTAQDRLLFCAKSAWVPGRNCTTLLRRQYVNLIIISSPG